MVQRRANSPSFDFLKSFQTQTQGTITLKTHSVYCASTHTSSITKQTVQPNIFCSCITIRHRVSSERPLLAPLLASWGLGMMGCQSSQMSRWSSECKQLCYTVKDMHWHQRSESRDQFTWGMWSDRPLFRYCEVSWKKSQRIIEMELLFMCNWCAELWDAAFCQHNWTRVTYCNTKQRIRKFLESGILCGEEGGWDVCHGIM